VDFRDVFAAVVLPVVLVVLEVVDGVPRRAVAVYAHPDDADVSCGGALARWARSGCEVDLVVCCSGDKGTLDATVDPRELVAARSLEVEAGAAALGVTRVHQLGIPDGELENDSAVRSAIVRVLRTARPEAVVCPDPLAVLFGEHYFNHRDHRNAGWAVLDAVSPAAASPLYFPDCGPPWQVELVFLSASLEANVVVDISSVLEAKADAISCHRSQLGESGEWFRDATLERAEQAGQLGGVTYGEAFRRVRLFQ